jgi:phospholipid N-methyltransferase
VIVSGLPWASTPFALQKRILAAIVRSLAPTGRFTTFAYLPARWMPGAIRFRRQLEASFGHVELSPVVWRNLPPAFVYRCGRPSQGK